MQFTQRLKNDIAKQRCSFMSSIPLKILMINIWGAILLLSSPISILLSSKSPVWKLQHEKYMMDVGNTAMGIPWHLHGEQFINVTFSTFADMSDDRNIAITSVVPQNIHMKYCNKHNVYEPMKTFLVVQRRVKYPGMKFVEINANVVLRGISWVKILHFYPIYWQSIFK